MDNDKSVKVKELLDMFSKLNSNTQRKYLEHLNQLLMEQEGASTLNDDITKLDTDLHKSQSTKGCGL